MPARFCFGLPLLSASGLATLPAFLLGDCRCFLRGEAVESASSVGLRWGRETKKLLVELQQYFFGCIDILHLMYCDILQQYILKGRSVRNVDYWVPPLKLYFYGKQVMVGFQINTIQMVIFQYTYWYCSWLHCNTSMSSSSKPPDTLETEEPVPVPENNWAHIWTQTCTWDMDPTICLSVVF